MLRPPSPDAHWRDSARDLKFFFVDAKAAFPLIFFLMHIQWWTLYVALVAMFFFTALNRFGFSPMIFVRWLRSFCAGRRRIAKPWWI